MSYDTPDAVSAYTYAGAYDYLRPNLPLSARPSLLRTTAPEPASLFISGRVDQIGGKVSMQTPLSVRATPDTVALAPEAAPAADSYVLVLKTAKGGYRYPLQLQQLVTEHREDSLASFQLTISPADAVLRMQVWRGDQIVLEISRLDRPTERTASP